MDHGNFTSDMSALADGKGANAVQRTNATQADHAWSGSLAVDSNGNMAKSSAYAVMSGGDYSTRQKANADENASVYQRTNATGHSSDLRQAKASIMKAIGQIPALSPA